MSKNLQQHQLLGFSTEIVKRGNKICEEAISIFKDVTSINNSGTGDRFSGLYR